MCCAYCCVVALSLCLQSDISNLAEGIDKIVHATKMEQYLYHCDICEVKLPEQAYLMHKTKCFKLDLQGELDNLKMEMNYLRQVIKTLEKENKFRLTLIRQLEHELKKALHTFDLSSEMNRLLGDEEVKEAVSQTDGHLDEISNDVEQPQVEKISHK